MWLQTKSHPILDRFCPNSQDEKKPAAGPLPAVVTQPFSAPCLPYTASPRDEPALLLSEGSEPFPVDTDAVTAGTFARDRPRENCNIFVAMMTITHDKGVITPCSSE